MTTAPLPSLDTTDLGLEVPVSEIETRLRAFWESEQDRARVSMMNLVVYSEKPGSLSENSRAIRTLAEDHACRAILTEVNRTFRQATLRAWITAHCHLFHGTKATCSEQISFLLTGTASGRFRNTIFSHLHADLPVVFWWQGELSPLFSERLVQVIDRLVVDSAEWANPASSFQTILHLASQTNPNLIIQDFAWTRCWQFRLCIAGLFDEPAAQRMLQSIDRIEIEYSARHYNTMLLLLAWLAVQAQWSDLPGNQPGFLSATGHPIDLALSLTESDAPITRLSLHAGKHVAEISQTPDSPHLQRRVHAPGYDVSSLSPRDPTTSVELLADQLSRGGRNSMFQKILPRYLSLLPAAYDI
jgi:glucose-6-phosphate dehydrogenase assembly protein OpcA